MSPTRPLRLTPPQIQALRLLRDGWLCQSVGRGYPTFGKLAWAPFSLAGQIKYIAESCLDALHRRGWITWTPGPVIFAYDSSTVPGYTLVLTETGRQVAATLTPEDTP